MRVFAYHQEIPGDRFRGESELAQAWRSQWAGQGWDVVLLGEDDARAHPAFKRFKARAESFDGGTCAPYRVATWVRWLAFAAALQRWECGLLVDYDVFNRGFQPNRAADLAKEDIIVNLSLGQCAMPILCYWDLANAIPSLIWAHSHQVRRQGGAHPEMHDDPWMNAMAGEGVGLVHFPAPAPCQLWGQPGDFPLVHVASSVAGPDGRSKLAAWRELGWGIQ